MSSDSNKASLDCLYPEVMYVVCEHLSKPDLASLRLSSTRYSEIAAKEMCRTLHVMFTLKSFESMMNLAKLPMLSKFVVKISYEVFQLKQLDQNKHKMLAELCGGHANVPNAKPGTLPVDSGEESIGRELTGKYTDGWKTYQEVFEGQQYMLEFNYDTAALAKAFTSFTNLKSIPLNTQIFTMSPALLQELCNTLAIDRIDTPETGFLLTGSASDIYQLVETIDDLSTTVFGNESSSLCSTFHSSGLQHHRSQISLLVSQGSLSRRHQALIYT